jgi:hypothetical protein
MIYIGIDPDVDKSGVAYYDSKSNILELSNLTFFELYEYLQFARVKGEFKVVIEAGWLNKSNWHKKEKGSSALNAKIGQHTGANHEVGRKIVEMCEYLEIDFKLVRPTRKKLKADAFNKITGIIGRTNQEQRDAGMLVFGL